MNILQEDSSIAVDENEEPILDTNIYGKNVDSMRSTSSTLVPYTTEQTVGRIKVGRPVDSADVRTLLAADTNMTAYQRSVFENELNGRPYPELTYRKENSGLTAIDGYGTIEEGGLNGRREVQEGQLHEGGAL